MRKVTPLALIFLASGCYEIEPQLPRGYAGSEPRSGWPPPPVYSVDPFHPANRLFQRLFVLSAPGKPPLHAGDLPFATTESLGPVDRAEALGLLEELVEGQAHQRVTGPAVRAAMQSDLLAFLARLDAAGGANAELRKRMIGAVFLLAGDEETGAERLPPPMRGEGWVESGPRARAFRPSAADLRWTRIFRRPGEAMLLRSRVGARTGGDPALLLLGSEAWTLSAAKEGPPAARVFHLRRARLVRGEDPWEEVPPDAAVSMRNPDDPARPPLSGTARALCARCHPGPGLEVPAPDGSPLLPAATREQQLEDARRALEGVLPRG